MLNVGGIKKKKFEVSSDFKNLSHEELVEATNTR